MTPERWQQVESLFQSAFEREPDQRAAFLAGACAGDLSLQSEVESLLAADERAAGVIDSPVFRVAAELFIDDDARSAVGRRIGAYRIVGEISHGGMGVVYLAVRADEQYEKQVALKLIKRGMDTDAILRRFRHERQILASLEHPNIARLLDGGTTEDGLPYFVMEYIEGQPIDKYCDRHKLTTVERLKLFRTVCSAVHYAHQNLVVHRDLKQSNILVTADGVPKLLDFGIAKLLNPELSAQTIDPTATALRLMTPEYASPEQVRGETITTASDVYSLGVVLYELLTGHRPYRFTSRSPEEIARVICEHEAEKPSTAISRIETDDTGQVRLAPETVSKTREGQPEKLRRRLRGDLDNIVLKALRKEPQRRYASVNQLSEDIRRHLEGQPVIARKDTFSYRAGKFVKRNKVTVSVAAALVVLIIGSVIGLAIQSARIARERDKAEQVSAFLVDLFKVSDPSEAKGNSVTAREILDKGAEKIVKELKDQPEVQATLMNTIGVVYHSLGLYNNAVPLLEKALAIRRQTLGDEHPDVAQSLNDLAELLANKGDNAAAEPLHREALAINRKSFGDEHSEVGKGLNKLANLLRRKGDYAAAEPFYRESLALRRKLLGDEHLDVAESLNDLAVLLSDKGDKAGAETLFRESLAMHRRLLGDEHPYVAVGLSNLGYVLHDKGDYAAAEPLYREALARERKLYGNEYISVATRLNNLANLLRDKGDHAAAEPLYREALAINRKLFGDEHPDVTRSLSGLAELMYDKGDYATAEPLYRQALELRRKILPEEHPLTAETLVGLGALLTNRGNAQSAEPLLREGLEVRQKKLFKDDWRIAEAESVLGGCLTALRRYDEAESLLVNSYPIIKSQRGERNKRTLEALNRISNLYQAWGKTDKAAEYRAIVPISVEPPVSSKP